jgi:L-methionine (R)-S-oxide reductase
MDLLKSILAQPSWDEAVRTAVLGMRLMRDYYNWVGVYLLDDSGNALTLRKEHYLGLPTEHTRIPLKSGICGASATSMETLVIDDVKGDPRYIACSMTVQSEIVVPIIVGEKVIGVLDLDSDTRAAFTAEDQRDLEAVAEALARAWEKCGGSPLNS